MPRTCIIDLPGLTRRVLEALPTERTPSWFTELCGRGVSTVRPVLPAVTMPVQASMTTGRSPQEHGVVANGYAALRHADIREHLDLTSFPEHRQRISFWEQSNKLLQAPRIWQTDGRSAAMLFMQGSMGGAADVVVTPKPEHTEDGRTIPDCWSDPPELHQRLVDQLGPFPLHHFWGPAAGLGSSQWIAAAARMVWEWHPTDLMWVYIPQLDYDLQKGDPHAPENLEELPQALALLTPLVEKVHADGGRVLLVSEYGLTPIASRAAPNVHLREAGLLARGDDGDIDYENTRAFAMADHQVAHVFCADEEARAEAKRLLGELGEVDRVYEGHERAEVELDTPRAGDPVAFARPDAWFEYRWWTDFAEAPPFAWEIDIHRKPGYDPTEMYADPETGRTLAERADLIRGSHGALPPEKADWPVLVGCGEAEAEIRSTDVARLI